MDQGPQTADTNNLNGVFNMGMDFILPPKDVVNHEFVRLENSGADITKSTNLLAWTNATGEFYKVDGMVLEVDIELVKTVDGVDVRVSKEDHTVLASNGFSVFRNGILRIGNEQIQFVDYPGKLSQMRNVFESGRDYMQTVGPNSHYYLDEIGDEFTTTKIDSTPTPALGATGAAGAITYHPNNWNDEVQYGLVGFQGSALVTRPVNNVSTNVTQLAVTARKNPKFDSSFEKKLQRCTDGVMKCYLPLRDVFSFLEYPNTLRGSRIEVEFNKHSPTDAGPCTFGQLTDVRVKVSKFAMWIPRLKPSLAAWKMVEAQMVAKPVAQIDFENIQLVSSFVKAHGNGEQTVQIGIKQRRPTKVLVGFQHVGRDSNVKLNPLQFDLLGPTGTNNIFEIALWHNGVKVPQAGYYPKSDPNRIISELHRIGYKEGDIADSACITVHNWQKVYPLFAFSVENIEGAPYESKNNSYLELKYRTISNDNTPADYHIHTLIYSEASAYIDSSSGISTVRIA